MEGLLTGLSVATVTAAAAGLATLGIGITLVFKTGPKVAARAARWIQSII